MNKLKVKTIKDLEKRWDVEFINFADLVIVIKGEGSTTQELYAAKVSYSLEKRGYRLVTPYFSSYHTATIAVTFSNGTYGFFKYPEQETDELSNHVAANYSDIAVPCKEPVIKALIKKAYNWIEEYWIPIVCFTVTIFCCIALWWMV